MALQMLYQHELGESSLDQLFDSFDLESYLDETETTNADAGAGKRRGERRTLATASFGYARELVTDTVEHLEEIDALIRRHAENWRLERMTPIDRNILRLAFCEMLYQEGVPKVVIVDEAIELAKKFGAESSGRFVNGLLDGFLQSSRPEVMAGPSP
jgi:N utilization substance protein B